MALCKQIGARRLTAQTQAENVRAATATYDSCFGPGAFAADTPPRTHRS